jgi:hypothetical protein
VTPAARSGSAPATAAFDRARSLARHRPGVCRRAPAIAENEHAAAERVLGQFLPHTSGETVDAATKIRWLGSHPDTLTRARCARLRRRSWRSGGASGSCSRASGRRQPWRCRTARRVRSLATTAPPECENCGGGCSATGQAPRRFRPVAGRLQVKTVTLVGLSNGPYGPTKVPGQRRDFRHGIPVRYRPAPCSAPRSRFERHKALGAVERGGLCILGSLAVTYFHT